MIPQIYIRTVDTLIPFDLFSYFEVVEEVDRTTGKPHSYVLTGHLRQPLPNAKATRWLAGFYQRASAHAALNLIQDVVTFKLQIPTLEAIVAPLDLLKVPLIVRGGRVERGPVDEMQHCIDLRALLQHDAQTNPACLPEEDKRERVIALDWQAPSVASQAITVPMPATAGPNLNGDSLRNQQEAFAQFAEQQQQQRRRDQSIYREHLSGPARGSLAGHPALSGQIPQQQSSRTSLFDAITQLNEAIGFSPPTSGEAARQAIQASLADRVDSIGQGVDMTPASDIMVTPLPANLTDITDRIEAALRANSTHEEIPVADIPYPPRAPNIVAVSAINDVHRGQPANPRDGFIGSHLDR